MEKLDSQVQEQEKLKQNARTMLSMIQRSKGHLIELHPTITDEANRKLKVFDLEFFLSFSSFVFYFRKSMQI